MLYTSLTRTKQLAILVGLEMEPLAVLQTEDEPAAQYLLNSSSGRWKGSLDGAVIGLELVSISSGLNIANEAGTNISSAGW